MRYLLLRALIIIFAAHAPFCSKGTSALRFAIDQDQPDVIAFLRSVGAPE